MELYSPYLFSLALLVPTIVLTMGLFSKKKFVVEGRVRFTRGNHGRTIVNA